MSNQKQGTNKKSNQLYSLSRFDGAFIQELFQL